MSGEVGGGSRGAPAVGRLAAALAPFAVGAAVVVVLLLVDLAARRATLAAFTALEVRQYALSALGSVGFWAGLAALLAVPLRSRPLWWARTGATFLGAVVVLFVPWAMFLSYRRLPNEAAVRFFANEWRFALRSAGSMFSWTPLLLTLLLVAGFWVLVRASRRLPPSRIGLFAAVVALAADVTVLGVSKLSPSLPLLSDACGLRFVALLVGWGGHPPPFFAVAERTPPPLPVAPPLPVDVLFVVHETMGAEYLVTPDGREVTPSLLALSRDPAAVWLERLHTQSSCTDVSVPSLLSGVSTATGLLWQQPVRLPFDVARAAGAFTFVTASHRMGWATLDAWVGAKALDVFVPAETIDPACDDDVGVPDERAYRAALEAMDRAHASGRRFVGLVKTNASHGPYQVDPKVQPFADEAGFPVGRSAGFVRYLNSLHHGDAQFGDFWRALAARPWFDEVLVVVTADHGEAFGQHELWSHCGSFFPEESHVPGLLRLPRRLREAEGFAPARSRLDAARHELVGAVDLLPTVAGLLGWTPLLEGQFDGHSWLEPLPPQRRYVFTNCSDARGCPVADFGVWAEGVRWVYSGATRRWQAFDEEKDPRARVDVAASHREQLERVLEALRASPREGGVVSRLLGEAGAN